MKKTIKLIVDTNIFVNAFFKKDKYPHCVKVIDEIIKEDIILVFSQPMIGELIWNIKNQVDNVYHFTSPRITNYIYSNIVSIIQDGLLVNTKSTKFVPCNDPEDDMLIQGSVESNANFIITLDYNSGMHDETYQKLANINTFNAEDFVKWRQQQKLHNNESAS